MAESFVPVTTNNLSNQTSITNAIDQNFSAVATAFTDVLSRGGTTPNTMQSVLDMNSNQIINLPSPGTPNSPARLIDIGTTITAAPAIITGNNVYTGTNSFNATTNFNVINVTTLNLTTSNVITANITTANISSATITTATVSTVNVLTSVSTPLLTGCFGSFRADLGGTSMVYATTSPNAYIRFSPGNVETNLGSAYFTSGGPSSQGFVFSPPTGTKLVHLTAHIWITSGGVSGSNCAIKWIKNGTWNGSGFQTGGVDIVAGEGCFGVPTSSFFIVAQSNVWDVPNNGDYYQLGIFCDGATVGSNITIDGNAAHSHMSGFYFQ